MTYRSNAICRLIMPTTAGWYAKHTGLSAGQNPAYMFICTMRPRAHVLLFRYDQVMCQIYRCVILGLSHLYCILSYVAHSFATNFFIKNTKAVTQTKNHPIGRWISFVVSILFCNGRTNKKLVVPLLTCLR